MDNPPHASKGPTEEQALAGWAARLSDVFLDVGGGVGLPVVRK
ncbi:hypothetical protein ACQP1G_16295 [Nocardia sp. CA-107356]